MAHKKVLEQKKISRLLQQPKIPKMAILGLSGL
jgi:hypothetical protein